MEVYKTASGSVEGKAESKPAKKGPISRIEIEIADEGGAIVQCYYKNKPSTGNGPYRYTPPTKCVFEDGGGVLAHVAGILGASMPAEDKD